MTQMTWFEVQVVTHGRILISGYLESTRGRNDEIGACLTGVQLVRPRRGRPVLVVLSYIRLDPKKPIELKVQAERVGTTEEALECWHGQFYGGYKDADEHNTVRMQIGIGGPRAKLSDPWVLYHLGVVTQLARGSDELLNAGQGVRDSVVDALEKLTIARVKQLTEVVGRR